MKASKTFTTTAAAVALISAIGLAYAQSSEEPVQPPTAQQAQMPTRMDPATPLTAVQQQQRTQDGQGSVTQQTTQPARQLEDRPVQYGQTPMQTQSQAQTQLQTPSTQTAPAMDDPVARQPYPATTPMATTPMATTPEQPYTALAERAPRPDRN